MVVKSKPQEGGGSLLPVLLLGAVLYFAVRKTPVAAGPQPPDTTPPDIQPPDATPPGGTAPSPTPPDSSPPVTSLPDLVVFYMKYGETGYMEAPSWGVLLDRDWNVEEYTPEETYPSYSWIQFLVQGFTESQVRAMLTAEGITSGPGVDLQIGPPE